jgi:hypothetical protein
MLEDLVDDTVHALTQALRLRACWFEPFPFDRQLARIEPGRILLPGDEPGIEPWTCDAGVELPVRGRGLTLGRFVLVPYERTTGVGFAPLARAEALVLAGAVGERLATELGERDHTHSS